MSQKEIVERARVFANHPTHPAWVRLVGEAGILSAPAAEPETIGPYLKRMGSAGGIPPKPQLPEHIKRSAEFLQAALSDIAHQRQTRAQIEAWEQTARRLTPTPSRTIEGKHVREAIQWAAALEVLDLPGGDARGNWCLVTVDAESLLATILMWLLNPELKFNGLHECGRGEQCEKERFHFRNRRFCSPECMKQVNRSTNTERSSYRRRRNKALKLLKPLFPARAEELMWQVAAPELSAVEIFERAKAAAARKHK